MSVCEGHLNVCHVSCFLDVGVARDSGIFDVSPQNDRASPNVKTTIVCLWRSTTCLTNQV